MLFPAPSLFGLPEGQTAVLDLTTDFAPLFLGLGVVVGLGLLGLMVNALLQESREARQEQPTDSLPPLPKAA